MNYHKLITLGSLVALTGYVASGPLGFLMVQVIHPQPAWSTPATFAANYNLVQDIPYYFGFLLTGGMLMLVTAHYLNYDGNNAQTKFHLLVAFAWTVAFFTLVTFNYICQTTFVRHLALNYTPAYDNAIATFSMVNPLSLCWANEIWGYAFLGVATGLMAGYYGRDRPAIRALLVMNAVVSIGTVVFTIADTQWLTTTVGLTAYFFWNILMIALMILVYRDARVSGNHSVQDKKFGGN
ncbi:MAG TPA: hypothetical protein VG737_02115 [Cyclobacteriaceae bacterium]|nr:hypothetical protein [Cyclobacteriaceae bacterium]